MRSRERILRAARGCDVTALRLNDIARDAGVGVGTVYRHFPTVRALVEALSVDSLRRLNDAADAAAAEPDALAALRGFLADALALQLQDAGLQLVLTDLGLEDPEARSDCTVARAQVHAGYTAVLARAQRAGVARTDVSAAQLQRLVCGLERAARLGSAADRPLLIDILLAGMRPVR